MTRKIRRSTPSQRDEAEILDYLGQANVDAGLGFLEALTFSFGRAAEP